jgi:hypothetical protein
MAGYETPDTVGYANQPKRKKNLRWGTACRTSPCDLGNVSNTGDILNSTPMQFFRDQRKDHLALFYWDGVGG